MNICDLEKKATPGPLVCEPAPELWFSANIWTLGGRDGGNHVATVEGTEDALILVHCRNNFMELLREFEHVLGLLEEQLEDDGWGTDGLRDTYQMISRMKRVDS